MEANELNERVLCASNRVIEMYVRCIKKQFDDATGNHKNGVASKSNKDNFCYIPFGNPGRLLKLFIEVYDYLRVEKDRKTDYRTLRFLDCGCGLGNILILAKAAGFSPDGIEYDTETFNTAKKILGISDPYYSDHGITMIKGDILDFNHYGKYDVIYFYVPIRNGKLMDKFSKRLIKKIKPGTIVIPVSAAGPYHRSKVMRAMHDFKFDPVYIKTR